MNLFRQIVFLSYHLFCNETYNTGVTDFWALKSAKSTEELTLHLFWLSCGATVKQTNKQTRKQCDKSFVAPIVNSYIEKSYSNSFVCNFHSTIFPFKRHTKLILSCYTEYDWLHYRYNQTKFVLRFTILQYDSKTTLRLPIGLTYFN